MKEHITKMLFLLSHEALILNSLHGSNEDTKKNSNGATNYNKKPRNYTSKSLEKSLFLKTSPKRKEDGRGAK